MFIYNIQYQYKITILKYDQNNVTNTLNLCFLALNDISLNTPTSPKQTQIPKDTCIIDPNEKYREEAINKILELVTIERNYIKGLSQVLEYTNYMEKGKRKEEGVVVMPESLKKGKDRIAFGNIQDVLEYSEK